MCVCVHISNTYRDRCMCVCAHIIHTYRDRFMCVCVSAQVIHTYRDRCACLLPKLKEGSWKPLPLLPLRIYAVLSAKGVYYFWVPSFMDPRTMKSTVLHTCLCHSGLCLTLVPFLSSVLSPPRHPGIHWQKGNKWSITTCILHAVPGSRQWYRNVPNQARRCRHATQLN